MKTIIAEVIKAALILGIVYILAGCGTFAGLGEDITDSANTTRKAMITYAESR